MTMKGDAKLKAKLPRGLKIVVKNLDNFLASSRKSENLHFDGLLLYKAYKVLVEKVQKNYVSWQWLVTQSLKKNWLLVNFNASNGKPENLHFDALLLVKSIPSLSQKCTEELYDITLKKDAKFEEEQPCSLKNDIRNLTNFDPTLESLKVYTLMESFWPKYKMFELKKCRGVMYHYTEDRCKHIRKNKLWFHKWHEEFGELHQRTQKNDLKICPLREFFV